MIEGFDKRWPTCSFSLGQTCKAETAIITPVFLSGSAGCHLIHSLFIILFQVIQVIQAAKTCAVGNVQYLSLEQKPGKQLVTFQALRIFHLRWRQLPTHTDCRGDTAMTHKCRRRHFSAHGVHLRETYRRCWIDDIWWCPWMNRTTATETLEGRWNGSTEEEAGGSILLQPLTHLSDRKQGNEPEAVPALV